MPLALYTKGRPTDLTEELIEHILQFVPRSYVLRQVARRAMLSHQRLSEWLKKGKEHMYDGTDSIYAQFAAKYEQKMGIDIDGLVEGMLASPKWQSKHEILKSAAAADFGKDAEIYKDLLADFQKLLQSVNK